MLKYYPPRMPKISALNKEFPELGAVDYLEEQRYACPSQHEGYVLICYVFVSCRLADNFARRKRGKGAPKKGKKKRFVQGETRTSLIIVGFGTIQARDEDLQ